MAASAPRRRRSAMELEAARRAVLAAVRGTCAADLPRLLHWMRNTSKRGPARELRSGCRCPPLGSWRGPAGGGPAGRSGPELPRSATVLAPSERASEREGGRPSRPVGGGRVCGGREGGSGVPPPRGRARARLTVAGLRGAVPGLGRSAPRAGVGLCRRHKADRARRGASRPAAPPPFPPPARGRPLRSRLAGAGGPPGSGAAVATGSRRHSRRGWQWSGEAEAVARAARLMPPAVSDCKRGLLCLKLPVAVRGRRPPFLSRRSQ